MDRIEHLAIFVRVVESGGFTRAASLMQLPRSSVSSAVKALEARVGARLLYRTTRRVSLTHEGQAFYERCVRLLADYEEAEALFRQDASQPRGRVRANVPGRMGRLLFAPALPDFLARYPDIEVELGSTDRAVDLVQEGVDCAVRVGPLSDSSLIARRVGDLRLINCASPAYVRAHGAPQSVEDLGRHYAVNYASPSTGRIEDWEYVERGEARFAPMRARVTVNSAEAYIACCLAGLGLIQIPAYDVRHHVEAAELLDLAPGLRAAPMPLTILYPHRQHLSHRVQVFVDWAEALLREKALAA